ncbi:MAG: hypothetical protein V4454_11085 [Pseudomonadota bacterium]
MSDLTPVQVLKKFVQALERLSESDASRLCDPAFDIEVKLVAKRKKQVATVSINTEELLRKLQAADSRDIAHTLLLTEATQTRSALEPIARALDIPINKQDKLEVLRDRIVEATVGSRLRSLAIKGDGIPR